MCHNGWVAVVGNAVTGISVLNGHRTRTMALWPLERGKHWAIVAIVYNQERFGGTRRKPLFPLVPVISVPDFSSLSLQISSGCHSKHSETKMPQQKVFRSESAPSAD
jgi:hypothetical protein